MVYGLNALQVFNFIGFILITFFYERGVGIFIRNN